MTVPKLNISTFNLDVPKRGVINSDDLNSFFKAVATDLAAIQNFINNTLNPLLASLPDNTSKLDGANIFVDQAAAGTKDYGVLFLTDPNNPSNNRPLTIYEAYLNMIQILANTENGMREGVTVGNFSQPQTLAIGASVSFTWPYTDKIFKNMLFVVSGATVSEATSSQLSISVNTSTNQITITNTSGASISFWGYIWHPVLTF